MAAGLVSRHRGYHTRGIRAELLFGVSGVSKRARVLGEGAAISTCVIFS
jgi:hypothetical protein